MLKRILVKWFGIHGKRHEIVTTKLLTDMWFQGV